MYVVYVYTERTRHPSSQSEKARQYSIIIFVSLILPRLYRLTMSRSFTVLIMVAGG